MIINTEYVTTEYTRISKLGYVHSYFRRKTIIVLRCDSCGLIFNREKGSIAPARVSNQVYHVCNNCDVKSFAQSKGVERRAVWKMPVSSLKTLDHL
jgi:rubredoxin